MPKYNSVSELLDAAKTGEFTGRVVIDNDCVSAYQDEEEVFRDDNGDAFISIFEYHGVTAEYA